VVSSAHDIDERAAGFLARRDSGDWTSDDEQAFDAWIAERTEHRVSYLRLLAGWNQLDRLAALQGTAVAPPPPEELPANDDDHGRWTWLRRGAGAAAVLALLVIGGFSLQLWRAGPDRFATAVGGRQSIPLADGTRIDLNTDSKLLAAVDKTSRRVWLEHGEAYFDVAHDPQHPFVVDAGKQRVVVLGTKFVVRRDGDRVIVRVLEGRVRVESTLPATQTAAAPAIVLPGDEYFSDRASANGAAGLVKRGAVDEVEDALAWRDGVLTFDAMPLAKAAAEFNRYNRKQLTVSNPAAQVRIEGTFTATDVEAFVRIMREAYGFKVRQDGNDINIS
jgi:transmembrane sensor